MIEDLPERFFKLQAMIRSSYPLKRVRWARFSADKEKLCPVSSVVFASDG
jgi:hypothetical protein